MTCHTCHVLHVSHNNTVPRVRPISHKEQRNRDEGIIQFPGEGQIWVGRGY